MITTPAATTRVGEGHRYLGPFDRVHTARDQSLDLLFYPSI
jgi:hypothetical protein